MKSTLPSNRLKREISRAADSLFKQQVAWRRHLHQHPELSCEEYETTAFLRDQVKKIGLKQIPIKLKTGLLAEVVGKEPGPTMAVRTDIDALPILERTGLPYKSKIDGRMHACGHDVHMATILGTAAALTQLREHLAGRVRFIFQPAEELPPGGARPMIENGCLEGVSMIFGLHVDPNIKVGRIGTRDGATMAAVNDFDIIVRGVGGHAARPHSAVDAIATAAEVVESLQKVVSREIDPTTPVVITFGQISGGTARNVIAEEVRLNGTIRTLSRDAAREVPKLVKRTVTNVCKARGAVGEIQHVAAYPVLYNDGRVNRIIEGSYTSLYDTKGIESISPGLGGEDFACYLEKVPGAMFRLGIRNSRIKADKSWHSPKFIVDEGALTIGTATLVGAVLDACGGKK